MLFAILIVLFGVSSSALTTFGKSNTNQQAPPPTKPPVKAKECTNHADCATITNTSCVTAPDGKQRCMCGDYEAPTNGYCQAKFKGLKHLCTDTMQCDVGMSCTTENVPKATLGSSKPGVTGAGQNNNGYKVCLCDKELGYEEDAYHPYQCSSAISIALSGMLIPLLTILLGISIDRFSFSCPTAI